MKKIFGAKQHKELDKLTCIAQKISSYELMERAVNELFVQLCADILCLNNFEYHIFAGTGNNGGDGLGLARKLINENCNVRVWFCNYSNNIAEECKTNLELLQSTDNNCVTVLNEGNLPKIDFPYNAVIIDAIFGAGLNRAVGGNYAEVIRLINNTSAKVISIDLPSGLFVEDNSHNDGEIVCADMTYKIGNFPLAAMFAENSKYFGRIKTIDIGYDATTEECLFTDYKYLEEEDLNSLFKLRGAFDHKGSFGHGLLIAGSYGKAGAAIMSARAALRSGIGLLTLQVPCNIANILQVAVPEAMLEIDTGNFFISNCIAIEKFSAIGIGPGIGNSELSFAVLANILSSNKPKVIDADGLNLLSQHHELYSELKNCILTPHPKEFERMFGTFANSIERLHFMSKFAKEHGCCIILKGGVTTLALSTGELAFYIGMNPAIATGGSGDVLTGILTSLLAQDYTIDEAAKIGVWVHGNAGKAAANYYGDVSTIATDIISYLPETFKCLYERKIDIFG